MKSRKFFIFITILTFIFMLTSCDKTHEHQFGEDYDFNETQHWFVPTCDHQDEKGQIEKHVFSEWTIKEQGSCTTAEVLKRFCLTCFYEETKTGEAAGHKFTDVPSKNATCLADGVKAHKHCSVCNMDFDANGNVISSVVINKLEHSMLEEWQHDESIHYKVCINGCTELYNVELHSFVENAEVPAGCDTSGVKAYKECSICHAKYDYEGNYIATAEDLIIDAVGHKYSEDWESDDTHHWHSASCSHTTEISEKSEHTFDETTGQCVCGKKILLTLIGTHEGTSTWQMTDAEKLTSTGVIYQNYSSMATNNDGTLVDFSQVITLKGWASNYEAYQFTLASSSNDLTLKIQLGIDPWTTYTTVTLADEHKLRLASEEGLDLIIYFNKEASKLAVYTYTNHELKLLHELDCYSAVSNFYEVAYKNVVSNSKTQVFKTYETSIDVICNTLGIDVLEHNVLTNVWLYDENTHWNPCIGCDGKNNEVQHNFNVEGECECGFATEIEKEVLSLLGSHNGTSEWNMVDEEKLSSNGIFHHNVKVTADSEGNIADFSLQIQYRGWENNGERTYFYTISSQSGVLKISNQLGIEPWSYTHIELNDENKALLASEKGLDFVVRYNHDEQKIELYVYKNHEFTLVHTLDTYYGSMSNFYKMKYSLTGSATITTTTYKTYDTLMSIVFEQLNIDSTEHNVLTNTWKYDDDTHWNSCVGCDVKYNEEMHNYNADNLCVCGHIYEEVLTLLGTHSGTAEWNMANEEKLSTNGIFHQNVKVTADSEGNISDFSLQIQYRGWENNGERTYFYTISSESGVLKISNQLGIDPWSFTHVELTANHKASLLSEEGLDFIVLYNHEEQKISLYIYGDGELTLVHSLNTYYGSMANFYKMKYSLTGNATITTTTYKTSTTDVEKIVKALS